MIGGVCAGIAGYLGWSTRAVRIAWVLISVASAAFPGILVYAVLWLLMPPPPRRDKGSFDLEEYRVQ